MCFSNLLAGKLVIKHFFFFRKRKPVLKEKHVCSENLCNLVVC